MNETKKCACGNAKLENEIACPECMEDLEYIIASQMTKDGKILTAFDEMTVGEFITSCPEHGIGPVGICAICGGHYVFGGNNPYPVIDDEESRCCSKCNREFVIPTRMAITKIRSRAHKVSLT